jgi:hypothetical protein
MLNIWESFGALVAAGMRTATGRSVAVFIPFSSSNGGKGHGEEACHFRLKTPHPSPLPVWAGRGSLQETKCVLFTGLQDGCRRKYPSRCRKCFILGKMQNNLLLLQGRLVLLQGCRSLLQGRMPLLQGWRALLPSRLWLLQGWRALLPSRLWLLQGWPTLLPGRPSLLRGRMFPLQTRQWRLSIRMLQLRTRQARRLAGILWPLGRRAWPLPGQKQQTANYSRRPIVGVRPKVTTGF